MVKADDAVTEVRAKDELLRCDVGPGPRTILFVGDQNLQSLQQIGIDNEYV